MINAWSINDWHAHSSIDALAGKSKMQMEPREFASSISSSSMDPLIFLMEIAKGKSVDIPCNKEEAYISKCDEIPLCKLAIIWIPTEQGLAITKDANITKDLAITKDANISFNCIGKIVAIIRNIFNLR